VLWWKGSISRSSTAVVELSGVLVVAVHVEATEKRLVLFQTALPTTGLKYRRVGAQPRSLTQEQLARLGSEMTRLGDTIEHEFKNVLQ